MIYIIFALMIYFYLIYMLKKSKTQKQTAKMTEHNKHVKKVLNCDHDFYKEDDEEGGYYNVCKRCGESEHWIKIFNEEAKNRKLTEF